MPITEDEISVLVNGINSKERDVERDGDVSVALASGVRGKAQAIVRMQEQNVRDSANGGPIVRDLRYPTFVPIPLAKIVDAVSNSSLEPP